MDTAIAHQTLTQETIVNQAAPTHSPNVLWRRPPIYAATRLRCAVALLVFAVAVLLASLPSLAA